MRRVGSFVAALAIAYAAGIVAWQGLRLLAGDRWWWLGLANTLSLYLFLPLPIVGLLAVLSRRRAAIAAAVVPLVVFVVLYGGLFLPRPAAGQARGAPTLRVMSYNVMCLNRDADAVERTIRSVAPDVICMQEITPFLAEELTARLGAEYPYWVLLPAPGTNGMGVFSRLPLYDAETVADPFWEPGSQALQIALEGRRVLVMNVHAFPSWLPESARGDDLRQFQQGYRLREEESRRWLARAAAHPGPVVMAGDLNAPDQNVSVRMLARELQDAQRRVGWGPGHTWPSTGGRLGRLPYPPRLWRLDYVLATGDWQVIATGRGPWDGQSDHLPVWADLALEE